MHERGADSSETSLLQSLWRSRVRSVFVQKSDCLHSRRRRTRSFQCKARNNQNRRRKIIYHAAFDCQYLNDLFELRL